MKKRSGEERAEMQRRESPSLGGSIFVLGVGGKNNTIRKFGDLNQNQGRGKKMTLTTPKSNAERKVY